MNTDKELMQQALEALTHADEAGFWELQATVVTALRSRLAQPEQKPVAGECKSGGLNIYWYATHGMIQVTFE